MSLDITLLPFDGDDFSHTVLPCHVNSYSIFDEIKKIITTVDSQAIQYLEEDFYGVVPERFTSYLSILDNGEYGYGVTTEDHYGKKLMWVLCEDLVKLKHHPTVLKFSKNKATWSYLENLPPKTKVALLWS